MLSKLTRGRSPQTHVLYFHSNMLKTLKIFYLVTAINKFAPEMAFFKKLSLTHRKDKTELKL